MRKRALEIPVRTLKIAALSLLATSLDFSMAKAGADGSVKPAFTIDGRFNSNCLRKNGYTDEPVCFVPFPRLIAQPERFDGRYILLVGFLGTNHGVTELFSNSDSFKHLLPLESINVGKIPPELDASLKKGIWVVVVGKFDATFAGPAASLGSIWEPLDISPYDWGNERKPSPPSLLPFQKPKPPVALPPTLK